MEKQRKPGSKELLQHLYDSLRYHRHDNITDRKVQDVLRKIIHEHEVRAGIIDCREPNCPGKD